MSDTKTPTPTTSPSSRTGYQVEEQVVLDARHPRAGAADLDVLDRLLGVEHAQEHAEHLLGEGGHELGRAQADVVVLREAVHLGQGLVDPDVAHLRSKSAKPSGAHAMIVSSSSRERRRSSAVTLAGSSGVDAHRPLERHARRSGWGAGHRPDPTRGARPSGRPPTP